MSWLLRALMNRVVLVHADGSKVYGRLLAIFEGQWGPDHRPAVLVLETASGLCIIRDWTAIAFSGRL